MKDAFDRFVAFLITRRLNVIASVILSLTVSSLDKRPTMARWDGEDWEFKWFGGCLYYGTHRIRPKLVTTHNLRRYLMGCTPKSGDTVLEVGAGAGTEVCSLSGLVGPSGRVIAIEADPVSARRLRKQARCLPYRNVTVLELAAGAETSVIRLHVDELGGIRNSVAVAMGEQSVEVQCRPLADVLADLRIDRVEFMKMNIEGAEYAALQGLGSAIGTINSLVVSCHDFTGTPAQRTFEPVMHYLRSLGIFQITTLPPNPRAPWEDYYIFATRKPDS